MTTLPITKEIVYDRETKDYAAYVTIDDQREYIGSRRTQSECDKLCDEYTYHYYTDNHTPEVAAAIAVEMSAEKKPVEQRITPDYRDPVFPAGSNCGGEYPRR